MPTKEGLSIRIRRLLLNCSRQPALNRLDKLGYREVWRNKKNWDPVEREALTFANHEVPWKRLMPKARCSDA